MHLIRLPLPVFLFLAFSFVGSAGFFAQSEFGTTHDSINWVDVKGLKQGKFRKVDKEGKAIYEGVFKNDKPTGTFRYFDEDGKVTAVSVFSKDGKSCHTTTYHRNGNKWAFGKYINQQRDSVWTFFAPDTFLVARETYLGGKRNGASFIYLPDGGIIEQSIWKNGIEDGPWKEFYEDGKVKSEGTYVNGCLEGIVSHYCPEGGMRIQCAYHNCLSHGQWLFYTCGKSKPDHIVIYKNGKQIGEPYPNMDKMVKDGLEEFKERNEKEHEGDPAKEENDGGN